MRSRSTVRVMRGVGRWGPSLISLSVSEAGTAATAPTPARARAITASIVPRLTNGRAASWTRMIVASSGSASRPARTDAGHGTNLTTEAHLAEEQRVGGYRAIVDRGDKGRQNRQVGRGFDQTNASGHIDEYVEIPEGQAAAPLEHREQQGEAAMIESRGDALRRPESRL